MLKIMGMKKFTILRGFFLFFVVVFFCFVFCLSKPVCSLLSSDINTFSSDLALIMTFNLPNTGTYRSYNSDPDKKPLKVSFDWLLCAIL